MKRLYLFMGWTNVIAAALGLIAGNDHLALWNVLYAVVMLRWADQETPR